MNKSPEISAEGGSDSGVTNADTTSTSGRIETDHERGSESASGPAADSPEPTDRQGLPLDQTFELLRNQRRRYVLQYLEAATNQVSLGELAEQIAAWENDTEIDEMTSQQRKRVYVSLYQTHLPKLANTNLMDYDADEGHVKLTDRAADMDAFLSPKQSAEYSWRRHYLGILILGGALMALGIMATPILGRNVLLLLGGGILIGYMTTVAVEYWYHRKQQSEVPVELVPDEE